ncbi:MAG: carbohydrate binding family 9 domain-containing protein [Acidobacteria bacterium]|nr:carbohydrate binding family 9 domain-containing protein [Acidobacteriota bacterium]
MAALVYSNQVLNSKLTIVASVTVIVLIYLPPVLAQQLNQTASPATGLARPRPVATAHRVTETLSIDGALDERVWQEAEPLTDFVQAEPLEGQLASEKTEVRLLYDDNAIYVGVFLHDSDPSQIIITDTRRDANLDEMDSFQVIFDTFHDLQNGFVFGTNAAGIEYDAQVRSQGGFDSSWDGSWDVRTQSVENGWTAEFRIPLRTLRYGPPPQVWGLNFMRNIQRRREKSYWAPLARIYNLGRLSSAGELRDLDFKAPRNFKVSPYVTASANRNFTPNSKTIRRGDWGIDAKFGVTGSLNLDATYNTDFAQVEVDTEQINLTRFNLRFPEKRPFFLENSGLFRVGKSPDLDLFFSRRIGISEDGSLVPVKGGVRLSGKAKGLNVGMLNIQTEEVDSTPANNFTAVRVSRDLPSRSGLGVIFVNRTATGSMAGSNNWNRTFGFDGRFGIGERATLSGFAARTATPGIAGRQYAYNIDSAYDDGKHRTFFEYGVTGENFNPEVGFVRKSGGYRRMRVGFYETMRQPRVREMHFRELLPHASYTRFDYLDGGGIQNASLHVDNHFDWENGYFLSPALNITWEGLDQPFEVYPGVIVPPGVYRSPRFTLRVNTDRRKWLFGRIQWDIGGFLSGDQNTLLQEVILRKGGKFTVDTTWKRSDITLPQGAFVTNLGNMRVTYNFTPSVFAQSLIQYNDRTQRWSTNLRFHWLGTAGTGFFVVYNDTESLNGLGPVNRAFIIKYVRQFDLLR